MLEKLLLSATITLTLNLLFMQLGWSSPSQKSLELHQQVKIIRSS
jgi:hypothetical protein